MSNRIVTAARSYIGVPFRHRGRTRRGIDCVGLVWCAHRDAGIALQDRRVYGRDPHADGLFEALVDAFGEPVVRQWRPGDVAMIEFHGRPHHVAIIGDYLHGGLSLIHSYGDAGKVVEHRLDDHWRGKVLAVFAPRVD